MKLTLMVPGYIAHEFFCFAVSQPIHITLNIDLRCKEWYEEALKSAIERVGTNELLTFNDCNHEKYYKFASLFHYLIKF